MLIPSTNSLLEALTKAAELFTQNMFSLTDVSGEGGFPETKTEFRRTVASIRDATSISNAVVEGRKAFIDIIIDLKKAPYAGAYEFGLSKQYTITARNVPFLIFPKRRWPQYEPPPPAPEIFKFREVQHYGIEKNAFLAPTEEKSKEQITQIIKQGFKSLFSINRNGKVEVING